MSIQLGTEWNTFDQRLNRMPLLLAIETHRALEASTLLIEASARRGAPQDTRRLHSSINSRVEGVYPNLVGVVGPSVRYGYNVEFGRRPGRMPPVDALIGWVRRHWSPTARPTRSGRARYRAWQRAGEDALRSRAFALAISIARRGTRAQPYLAPAYNQNRAGIARIFRRLGLRVTASLAGNPLR